MKFCENYYFIRFALVVLAWSLLIKTTNLTEINGTLPEPLLLSRILKEYIKPMMQSFSQDSTLFRSFKETPVEKAVKEKIAELQDCFQDNDVYTFDEDNSISGGNDETAIIEFLPKTAPEGNRTKLDTFRNNLNEYKKLTQKIKKALTKESVSKKTNTLIVKTLEGLVKKLIEGQCNWKRTRVDKTDVPYLIANQWKTGWQSIKNTISKFLRSYSRRNNNIQNYVEDIHNVLKKVKKDADLISKKYKIQCAFVPKVSYVSSKENPNNLRNNWDKTEMEQDRCQNVVVCSNELRAFMLIFYKYLNDTTVTVLKNYADMFNKEVHTVDVEESKSIVSLLYNISNDLKDYIREIFIKETIKFKLDKEKNPDANIKFISDYIKNNIKNVKEIVRKILRTYLDNIRNEIVTDIRDDIKVNLDVDLGNLEEEFLKRICTSFRLCKGKYSGRRKNLFPDIVNKNNLNLQVQLAFDNVSPMYKPLVGLALNLNNTTKFIRHVPDVNVTRTTLMSNTTLIKGY